MMDAVKNDAIAKLPILRKLPNNGIEQSAKRVSQSSLSAVSPAQSSNRYDVYDDLTATGLSLPDDALGAAITELCDRGLIHVSLYNDWKGTPRHGAVIITLLKQLG